MDRRKALINLGILTGGITLFPSCNFSKEKVSIALHNLEVTEHQAALVKEIVSVLIPEGELPGAISLRVDEFVWVMVDELLDSTQQQYFLKGLNSFDDEAKFISGKSFDSIDSNKRAVVLKDLVTGSKESGSDRNKAVSTFIDNLKAMTIFGYMNSEFIMTEVMPYSLVPGKYGTCETIDTTKSINING